MIKKPLTAALLGLFAGTALAAGVGANTGANTGAGAGANQQIGAGARNTGTTETESTHTSGNAGINASRDYHDTKNGAEEAGHAVTGSASGSASGNVGGDSGAGGSASGSVNTK